MRRSATAKDIITTEAVTPSTPPLPGPPTMSATPASATAMARAMRRVIDSPNANQAMSAAATGEAACMKSTFATLA